jgi:hypothetical protein
LKNQVRRIVKDLWGREEYELVCGSNTGDPTVEGVFAIGKITHRTNSGMPCGWVFHHLKREDVKKLIEEYEAQDDTDQREDRFKRRIMGAQ